ncbi:hypothetical protein OESDEN_01845 [Oesophagostomum dentatum]|uniref:Uncharacterized protein n=1 Tax=Oesophagostomum dentatum TaxID=61180 RepID=A0A0B1TQ21_OESDE|nr:hypothetical protein OESDEN_01845 [Oesophagostomum dentatum]
MEGVVKRQSAVIRDLEAQLSASMNPLARPSPSGLPNHHLHKPTSNSPLIMRSMNAIRAEQTPTIQRRVHSDANLSNLGSSMQITPKAGRPNLDQNHKASKAKQTSSPMSAPQPAKPASSKTLNVCNPKNGRIQLDVPFVAAKLLIEFTHPIGTPILDYPVECHHCKIAGPIKLTLEIKTEPLNFLLTKKVQGVVKYTAFNGCRPKSVKMFCYLESAIKVRRWISSLVHTFAETDKIKFDIVLAKEQQIACFDRIVVFAVASTGTDKFVTNRVVFNIGQQAELANERPGNPQPKQARIINQPAGEPMETSSSSSPVARNVQIQNSSPAPAAKNVSSGSLDDSNFEVYRPF